MSGADMDRVERDTFIASAEAILRTHLTCIRISTQEARRG